jgi:hypothetical protein
MRCLNRLQTLIRFLRAAQREERHLLPLDLAVGVVLDDHDFDRELILHARGEFGHEHR